MKAALRFLSCASVLVALVGVGMVDGLAAEAQKYPAQDIVMIVPFVPGGTNDVVARLSAPVLRKYLPREVNIIVQNISVAGGRVGSFQVYDAKPDGYTLGVLEPLVFVVAEAMGERKRDITKMTWLPRASTTPFAMGVSPKSSIKTLDDIKKTKRIRASVTQSILAGNIAFLKFMGTEPHVIMYGGGAEACLAAMRGDVDVVITTASTLLRQAESSGGQLIPKVVFSESRLSSAPDLPTAKELGIDVPKEILTLMTFDIVFAAPHGLPPEIQKTINDGIEKTLREPGFVKSMETAKLPVTLLSSEEMQKRMADLALVVPKYIDSIREALPKVQK